MYRPFFDFLNDRFGEWFRTSAFGAGWGEARWGRRSKASQGGNRVQEKALAPLVRSMGIWGSLAVGGEDLKRRLIELVPDTGIEWPAHGETRLVVQIKRKSLVRFPTIPALSVPLGGFEASDSIHLRRQLITKHARRGKSLPANWRLSVMATSSRSRPQLGSWETQAVGLGRKPITDPEKIAAYVRIARIV
jgi:hypothetical protein